MTNLVIRRVVSVVMALAIFAGPSSTSAQDTATSFRGLRESVVKMIDWFGTLNSSVNSLAAAEDRRRLVDDLSRLSKAVYDLEKDKRFLLQQLERRQINVAAVQQAIEDSERSLRSVRERLRATGLSLRQQFREGGKDVERSLTDLTGSRKLWLEDLQQALQENRRPDLAPIIKEGKDLVESLSTAHQRLVELIDRLQRSG
jgi:chromosome segregation ATPase